MVRALWLDWLIGEAVDVASTGGNCLLYLTARYLSNNNEITSSRLVIYLEHVCQERSLGYSRFLACWFFCECYTSLLSRLE